MKKGQLFIITIVMIGYVISGLVGLTYSLHLEAQSTYSQTSSVPTVTRNVEKEMVKVTKMDPYNETLLNRSIDSLKNASEAKGIELEVNRTYKNNPENCDVDLGKSILPMNNSKDGRRFNITVRDSGELQVNSFFTVCWS